MPVSAHYHPRPRYPSLGRRFFTVASPARFDGLKIRYRNQRWADRLGLGEFGDAEWLAHFGRFEPLPDNLTEALALPYHGHQFHRYNPDLGDGRGVVLAELIDPEDERRLVLNTKGSGETAFSRDLDGRLTLKGAIREALAAEMLEALGVYTSKILSIVETGETVYRPDEPRPQRGAVIVRLSHGMLRIGSFQRLAAMGDVEALQALTAFATTEYLPEARSKPAKKCGAALMAAASDRLARMVAGWMVAGFAHGVLNTDNMSITGESFDFGPYHFLSTYDRAFVPASFDENGLYAFGRQPTEVLWDVQQLARALAPVAPARALAEPVGQFRSAFVEHLRRSFLGRIGIAPRSEAEDDALVEEVFAYVSGHAVPYQQFLHDWHGDALGVARAAHSPAAPHYQDSAFTELRQRFADRRPASDDADPFFRRPAPCVLDDATIRSICTAIDERDDWEPFTAKLDEIDRTRRALRIDPGVHGHLPLI